MVRLVKNLIIAAVAVILVGSSESSVEAQWGRTGYGVSGTGGYAAGGYNYGVTGGVRYRRYNRWTRRAYRRGYGVPTGGYYAGGGSGSYGSGGSYGSVGYSYDVCVACPTVDVCDPCGGFECGDDCDGCGGTVYTSGCDAGVCSVGPSATTTVARVSTPAETTQSNPVYAYDYQAPYREPVARRIDTVSTTSDKSAGDDCLRLTLNVPEDAEIFINGKPTKSTGAVRSYVTPPVEKNRWYVFSVRAVIHRDGEAIEKTQEIRVEPNAPSTLAFNFPAPSPAKTLETPETLITVVAPDDAKVLLAGVDTQSAGKVRVFKSRNLAAGQKWEGYHVTVQYSENGKLVTKSQKIDLVAGQSHELSFSDNDVQVASR